MYAHMLSRRNELLEINNQGVPAWEDRFLRLRLAARRSATRHASSGSARPRSATTTHACARSFDEVAELLADGRPYLCGERFTAADLTFAALAAAAVIPPGYGTPLPQPDELSGPVAAIVRSFREHPAGAYALKLFRTQRHTRAGTAAAGAAR